MNYRTIIEGGWKNWFVWLAIDVVQSKGNNYKRFFSLPYSPSPSHSLVHILSQLVPPIM